MKRDGFAPTCPDCGHAQWEHDKLGCTHEDEDSVCDCETVEPEPLGAA